MRRYEVRVWHGELLGTVEAETDAEARRQAVELAEDDYRANHDLQMDVRWHDSVDSEVMRDCGLDERRGPAESFTVETAQDYALQCVSPERLVDVLR